MAWESYKVLPMLVNQSVTYVSELDQLDQLDQLDPLSFLCGLCGLCGGKFFQTIGSTGYLAKRLQLSSQG